MIPAMDSPSRVSREVRLLALAAMAVVGVSSGLAITLMEGLSQGRIISTVLSIGILTFIYWQLWIQLRSARSFSVKTNVLWTCAFLVLAGGLEWLPIRSLTPAIALRVVLVQAVLLVAALVLVR